jgi:rhodanese-related sulfurtransferase
MQRLLEYTAHHTALSVLAVASFIAVLIYEIRERGLAAGAVSPQDAVRLMNQGAAVLDLRSSEQYATGHIRGARNLPLERLADGLDALKRYKDRPVIVYSEYGSQAAGALRTLGKQGFGKAVSLRGGLGAWQAEQLPLARD